MSLQALATLAEQAQYDGENRRKEDKLDPRYGVVGVKTRPGRGKRSSTLVVMTAKVFEQLFPTHH